MIKMRPLAAFLPLLCCFFLVPLCSGNDSKETVEVFKGGETQVSNKDDKGAKTVHTPTDFSVPAFVGGELQKNEFLAIICGASIQTASNQNTINGVATTSYGNHNQWSTAEIFTNDTQTSTTHLIGKEFTAVMNENKIYVLAKGLDKQRHQQTSDKSNEAGEPLMFVGTVTASTVSDVSGASIAWEAQKLNKDVLSNTVIGAQETSFFGGVGNSIVTKKGAIVFPVQISSLNTPSTSTIMYSINKGSTWTIGGITYHTTYKGSVVEWGDGKLLLIVSCNDGLRKVFETEDMGRTWKESFVFSRVWGNDESRKKQESQSSVITVPVDNEDVLLFAHSLSESGGSSADTLQLWLSDGKRIVRIGTISDSEKEDHFGNSILAHVDNHLYITREINHKAIDSSSVKQKKDNDLIGLTPLPEFFESAKETVRAWRKLDTKYKNKGVPTEQIVGFLGNAKADNSVWPDMYNCVNATVKGGESVSGGFKFNGEPGSGAQWPVQSQGQNQVYIFTENEFTLAATVTIHTENDNGDFSLIGACLDSQQKNVLLGLGYTHDNKWYAVSDNKKQTATVEMFVREKEYHVSITFAHGKASVYVDGVSITDNEIALSSAALIHHFYMGGLEQSSTYKWSSCTVKNVMLFNQPLLQSQIAKLTQVWKGKEERPAELPTLKTEGRKTGLKTKLANVPESSKPVSISEPKKAPVSSLQNGIYKKTNETEMHKSQHEPGNGILKKNTKGNFDSVMSLSSVGCIVFLCSFIVLEGF